MIDEAEIQERLKGSALVRGMDRVPRGHLRLETVFLYPDGSSVDVFVRNDPDAPLLPAMTLSDLGQTMSWLLDLQVQPSLSKKRQQLLADAIRLYDVHQVGGCLETALPSTSGLVEGVIRLGQACVRVADLMYTRRTSVQIGALEEVEEVLADAEVPYDTGVELRGRGDRVVKVDFLAHGRRRDSALLTLSSANSSQAHVSANELFRKWYDLSERNEQRITIFDDRYDTYRRDDLERLREKSDLLPLSDAQTLRELLRAA